MALTLARIAGDTTSPEGTVAPAGTGLAPLPRRPRTDLDALVEALSRAADRQDKGQGQAVGPDGARRS